MKAAKKQRRGREFDEEKTGKPRRPWGRWGWGGLRLRQRWDAVIWSRHIGCRIWPSRSSGFQVTSAPQLICLPLFPSYARLFWSQPSQQFVCHTERGTKKKEKLMLAPVFGHFIHKVSDFVFSRNRSWNSFVCGMINCIVALWVWLRQSWVSLEMKNVRHDLHAFPLAHLCVSKRSDQCTRNGWNSVK